MLCHRCQRWARQGVRMSAIAHQLPTLPVVESNQLSFPFPAPDHSKHHPPLCRCHAKHHPQFASPTNTPRSCSHMQRWTPAPGLAAGQPFVLHRDSTCQGCLLHSTSGIKSLISKAGKGGCIPSGLERQMGTHSSNCNWADWGHGLGRLGEAATHGGGEGTGAVLWRVSGGFARAVTQHCEWHSFASEMGLECLFPWAEQTHCSSHCHTAAESPASVWGPGEGFVLGAG